jgi:HlyD family secretion protein
LPRPKPRWHRPRPPRPRRAPRCSRPRWNWATPKPNCSARGACSSRASSRRRRWTPRRRRVDAAKAALASAQAGIAAAQAGQAQAQAQLQTQLVNRDNTEVRAPFDGVVLVKNANVGDMITPFSSAAGTSGAVVTMADMSTLEVEADVAEANVGKVRIEQPVEITLDALPELRLRGSVARIVPTVDRAKGTVMTKVRFDQIDPRVLPEMSAKVVFLSQAPAAADSQPVTAVNPKTVVERTAASRCGAWWATRWKPCP